MSGVVRVDKTSNYTVMCNHHLKDKSISLKAKGLLSQVLSLPEGWDYTISGLAYINKESVTAIGSAVDELQSAGYVERTQSRRANGQMGKTDYVFHEIPIANPQPLKKRRPCSATTADSLTAEPLTENPLTVEPSTEVGMQLNKDKRNKEKINTDSIIYLSINHDGLMDGNDEIRERNRYREIIQENIELYAFKHDRRYDIDRINGIVEMMLDVVCSNNDTIKINGAPVAQAIVKSRFLKLERKHIEYALDSMDSNPSFIKNPQAYMLTTLFNAPNTIDQYYTSLVNYHSSGKETSCKKK